MARAPLSLPVLSNSKPYEPRDDEKPPVTDADLDAWIAGFESYQEQRDYEFILGLTDFDRKLATCTFESNTDFDNSYARMMQGNKGVL